MVVLMVVLMTGDSVRAARTMLRVMGCPIRLTGRWGEGYW